MIQFGEKAVDKVHYFLKHAKQPDMVLRIELVTPQEQEPEYKFSLEPQEHVRPKDMTMPMHGFFVRMDAKTAIKLANRVVQWREQDGQAGFSILNAEEEHAADPSLSTIDQIKGRLRTIFDPEIPVNIYDMGLIYNIDVREKQVEVLMTLTAPNCPAAESLPEEVKEKIASMEGIDEVTVNITWDPAWTPDMMSEEARVELGM